MPAQNANTQQGQHVVASPNPTIDDSKTPATTGTKKAEATRVEPAQAATEAPMKTTAKPKSKSKHKSTKPRD